MIELPKNAAAILNIYGFGVGGADCTGADCLTWRTDNDGMIRFLATCSDTFHWGSADCEPIEEGDEILLQSCLDDLKLFGEEYYLSELFSSRKRGMRPMSLWLGTRGDYREQYPLKSLQLFLDAGPERDPKDEG